MHDGRRRCDTGFVTVLLAVMAWGGAAAQSQDQGIRASWTDFTTVNVRDPQTPFEQGLRVEMQDWRFGLVLVDGLASGRSALIHSVSAESVGFRWNGWDTGIRPASDQIDDLVGFGYRLAYARKTGRRWGFTPFGSIGMYSDFERTSADDILFQGGITFDRDLGSGPRVRQYLGLGAGYLNALGEPSLLPIFRYYREVRGSRVEVYLPELLDLRFTGKRWEFGFRAQLNGNTYRVSKDRTTDPGVGLKEDDKIRYSTGTGGLLIQRRLGRAVRIYGEFGSTFRQVLRVETAAGEEILDLDRADYTTVGVAFGL